MPNDEVTVRTDTPKKNSKKKIRRPKLAISKKRIGQILIVVLVLASYAAVYYVGDRRGADRQKKADESKRSSFSRNGANTPGNRWTAIGTITDVSDKKIKIKNTKGEITEADIVSDTAITDKSGKKVDAKTLKKDQKVVASGVKEDKGNKAQRIRLQQ